MKLHCCTSISSGYFLLFNPLIHSFDVRLSVSARLKSILSKNPVVLEVITGGFVVEIDKTLVVLSDLCQALT